MAAAKQVLATRRGRSRKLDVTSGVMTRNACGKTTNRII
ncbi:MAG: hypothetical protein JWP26_2268 [Devosia sp.]|nr:hypothetical protein [Devosia sp.]